MAVFVVGLVGAVDVREALGVSWTAGSTNRIDGTRVDVAVIGTTSETTSVTSIKR